MSSGMNTGAPATAGNPKWATWTGRVLSALVTALLIFSAVMKFTSPPLKPAPESNQVAQADDGDGADAKEAGQSAASVAEEFARLGYPDSTTRGIALTELASAILYAIPQTAVLGAIMLTGYLGGATATHVRVGDPFVGPIVIGVLVWLGVFLRDARLRQLIPLRR